MSPRPPPPPTAPKPGSLPPRASPAAPFTSVEDGPDDPTRLMNRYLREQSIFNAPTKIFPRVRSGGVLRTVGANLVLYTRRPSVNLALLLLAGLLLVGLGFVLGSVRRDQREPWLPPMAGKPSLDLPIARPARVVPTPPVAAIAVSNLPVAPAAPAPKEGSLAGRSAAGASSPHAASAEPSLLPDRSPSGAETAEPKKGYIAPIRSPGF